MPLDEPSVDTLLTTIAEDILVIGRFRGFDRTNWPMTMQPLLFRAAGLAAIVADRVTGERRIVMLELSRAIIGIMPPGEDGLPDEAAWSAVADAHARAIEAFAYDPRFPG